jgi:polar amino acid transport system substrate-binding protein
MMIGKLFRKSLWIVLISLMVLYGSFGCAPVEKKSMPQPSDIKVLRVGVSTNAPPLIFKQGQQIVGLEADFARELAKYLGKSLEFVELKWKDQIPALLGNRIDIIMSGMTKTTLRQVRVAFSTAYFRSGQMALIRNDDAMRFKAGFYSIHHNMVIGAVKNTTGEYFVQKQFGNNKIVAFFTSREGVEALIHGDIDMLIHDAPIILYLASENETKSVTPLFSLFTEEYLAWAIRKEDIQLIESANTFLEALNKDRKLEPMIRRWIPFTK